MSDSTLNNPLVNKEDIKDHNGISGIVRLSTDPSSPDYNKLLIFDHVKYGFSTIPIGKGPLHEDPRIALREELKEEINIDVQIRDLKLVAKDPNYTIDRGQGIITKVPLYCFDVLKYTGKIKNAEPHKHTNMRFLSIDEIKKLKEISNHTKMAVEYMEKNTKKFKRLFSLECLEGLPEEQATAAKEEAIHFVKFFVNKFLMAGRAYEKHVKPNDVNKDEFKKGVVIEFEHTKSFALASKIALDHLAEIPDYYTRLEKMEQEAKRELGHE